MARHISEREMRKIERERRKEEEEERKLLEELNRELEERQEMELRNLKEQQERIRRENAEKLERRRQINEKQKQIEEMKEKERIKAETQNRSDETKHKHDNTSPTVQSKVLKGFEYNDNNDDDESWTDAKSDESEFDDTYTTIEEIDQESALEIGYPQDASSFIDSRREKLRTVENEIKWLEQKERKYHGENEDIDRTNQRKIEKVVETSNRNLEDNKHLSPRYRMREHKKYPLFDIDYKGEDNEDRDIDYSESDEENELKEKIEQLQREKQLVAEKIETNKLLKEIQRKEIERKRMEDMKLRKEIRKRKEEKLRKLKDEKERLENELKTKKSTLVKLEREPAPEKEYTHKTVNREKQEEKVTKVYPKSEKLLKPAVPKLTESTFEEWKIEVEVIMNSGLYDENMLRQAVRNSLSGQMRKILLTIPASTSTKYIIEKLDGVYGNVRSGESVLAEFYMARQRRNEGIAEWGIRLESILQTALEKGQIQESQKDEMLKTRFWRQLYNEELKNATRMYFETSETFEELRRKVRVEENEMKTTGEDEHDIDKSYSTHKLYKGVNEEMEVLQDLVERMKVIEKEVSSTKETRPKERREQDYWRRSDRDENRQDDYYRKEKRYSEGERRDDLRYPREGERYRNKDRYYRENRTESRYDDRYKTYRERGRYSPSDRRTDRRDRNGKERDWRYIDDRSSYDRERRHRWRQDYDRNTRYDRDDRTSYGDRRQRDYERDKRDNREDIRLERNNGDNDKTAEKYKERDERQHNRNREEGYRRTEDRTTDTKSDLNSKMSLSKGR